MKIILISADRALAETLAASEIREGDVLTVVSDPEAALSMMAAEQTDFLIVSDRLAKTDSLSEWTEAVRSLNGETQTVLLLSNRHHADRNAAALKECLAEGWHAVQPGLTVRQLSERIGRLLYGEREGKFDIRNGLIQFAGTTPNIGTTVAAFGAAAHMALMTDRNIAFLCLNLKSSKIHRYLGDRDTAVSLDGLRAELRSGSLTEERLLRQSRRQKQRSNLHVIYGNMQREQADYYAVDEIECLLKTANAAFDYCVVETSAYWDNAGTIGTMLQAGQRILVTTPQLSHFQEDMDRWFRALSPVFGLRPADFDLLVTQTEPETPYRPKDIAKETHMSRIGEIRKAKELDQHLSAGLLWDAVKDGTPLGSDLSRLAKTLLTLHGESWVAKARSADQTGLWLGGLFPFVRRVVYARK